MEAERILHLLWEHVDLERADTAMPASINPFYGSELVREGLNRRPYVFADNEFESLIDNRLAAIKQGFDRIRGENRGIEGNRMPAVSLL